MYILALKDYDNLNIVRNILQNELAETLKIRCDLIDILSDPECVNPKYLQMRIENLDSYSVKLRDLLIQLDSYLRR